MGFFPRAFKGFALTPKNVCLCLLFKSILPQSNQYLGQGSYIYSIDKNLVVSFSSVPIRKYVRFSTYRKFRDIILVFKYLTNTFHCGTCSLIKSKVLTIVKFNKSIISVRFHWGK